LGIGLNGGAIRYAESHPFERALEILVDNSDLDIPGEKRKT
jgi:hypothetical protein